MLDPVVRGRIEKVLKGLRGEDKFLEEALTNHRTSVKELETEQSANVREIEKLKAFLAENQSD